MHRVVPQAPSSHSETCMSLELSQWLFPVSACCMHRGSSHFFSSLHLVFSPPFSLLVSLRLPSPASVSLFLSEPGGSQTARVSRGLERNHLAAPPPSCSLSLTLHHHVYPPLCFPSLSSLSVSAPPPPTA
ncbi:hypothetical protein ILYODFUR_014936 [Ilyodon furcidens]|uniref:Uncharacterized protein n=1 Tax=Ilyodon furcidens TaxID=33524 RepID=A0ABV0SY51_9TELE